jgi:hypothetical protein
MTEGKEHQGQQNMLQLTVSVSHNGQVCEYFQNAQYNISTHIQPFWQQGTDQHIWYAELVSEVSTALKLTTITPNAGHSANHTPIVVH